MVTSKERSLNIDEFRLSELVKGRAGVLKESTEIKHKAEVLDMASLILRKLITKVASNNIKKLEDLVNTGLKTIFHDQTIHFKIKAEVRRNLTSYRVILTQNEVEGSLDSFGGGVLCVLAFILKVIFLIFSKNYRILILDESLSFLSDTYINEASEFIKELSKEFDMTIIMVTHNEKFANASDLTYQINTNSGVTKFEKISN